MEDFGKKRLKAKGNAFFEGKQLCPMKHFRTKNLVKYSMFVKPGDIVQVVKGKDTGKVTEVFKVFPYWNRVLCWGVNLCIKNVRPMREEEVGQRVQVEAPFDATWLKHYSKKEGVAGNLGIRFEKGEDGIVRRIRYNKATGEEIPNRRPRKWIPLADRDESDEDDE